MILVLPMFSDPSFTQRITLDNVPYRLQFHWNYRGQHWTLSIQDAQGNPVLSGIKLVLQFNLLEQFRAYNIPNGSLTVYDSTGSTDRIGRFDFVSGRELVLVYVSNDES